MEKTIVGGIDMLLLPIYFSFCEIHMTHSYHFGGGIAINSFMTICSSTIDSSFSKFDNTTIIVGCLFFLPCCLYYF